MNGQREVRDHGPAGRPGPVRLALLLLPVLLPAVAGAETLRVPDDHPTVAAALERAEAGDVVAVGPGEHEGGVELKSGVTLRGAGMDATRLWASSDRVLTARSVRGAVVEDLHLQARYPADAKRTTVWVVDSQVTLRRCRVTGATLAGVEAKGPGTELVIVDSILAENTQNGAFFQEGAGGRLERNQLRKNGLNGIEVKGSGTAPTVVDNVVAENIQSGAFFQEGAGGRLERNLIAGNGYHGITTKGVGTAPTVVQNVVFENRFNGVWVRDGAAPVVRDNVIAENGFYGLRSGGSYTGGEADPGRPAASHNLLWNNGRGDFENFEPDATFVLADPKFVDPERWDFRLAADSPARGAGSAGDDIGLYPRLVAPSVVAARPAFETAKGGGAGSRPVAPPPARPAGKALAVVVGVQDYRDGAITDLRYARRDAEKVAAVLRRAGYTVRLLTDQTTPAADLEGLRTALLWLSAAGPDDRAVFYYSGHGSDQANRSARIAASYCR